MSSSGYNALYRNDTQLYSFLERAERLDLSLNYTGAVVFTQPLQLFKVEDIVVVRFPSFTNQTVTGNTALGMANGTIPSGWQPVGTVSCLGSGVINSVNVIWQFRITSAGALQIYPTSVSGANVVLQGTFVISQVISQPDETYLTYRTSQ